MAKDLTLKSYDGLNILYPKTVQNLVFNNVTGRPLSEDSKDICFDISEFKKSGSTPATYESLAVALGNNGANVPEGIRKGGMNIKYIDSISGNYVQWKYLLSSVSNADIANVVNWSLCMTNRSYDTDEWAYVLIDKNRHILYGIDKDGDFVFGTGVPKQIAEAIGKKYIGEIDSDEFVYLIKKDDKIAASIDKFGNFSVKKLVAKQIDSETTAQLIAEINNLAGNIERVLSSSISYTDNKVSVEATARDAQIIGVYDDLMEQIGEISTDVEDGSITSQKLAQDVIDMINASGGGTINNAADEEDLTTVDNKLKLKNRTGSVGRSAYVILRDTFTVSQNTTFDANTIYDIRYGIDLSGYTLTIQKGTVLYFNGGSIKNGCINSLGGSISAAGYQIFYNINVYGNFADAFKVEWFGAVPSDSSDESPRDSSTGIVAAINSGAMNIVGEGNYYLSNPVILNKRYLNLRFDGTVKVAKDCDAFIFEKGDIRLKINRLIAVSYPTDNDPSYSSALTFTKNCYNCNIDVNDIYWFGKGINLKPTPPDGSSNLAGIQYCKFNFQYIHCLEDIVFDQRGNASGGIWMNENQFLGGRLSGGTGIRQYPYTGNPEINHIHGNRFVLGWEGCKKIMDGGNGEDNTQEPLLAWYDNEFSHCRLSWEEQLDGGRGLVGKMISMEKSEGNIFKLDTALEQANIKCDDYTNKNIVIQTPSQNILCHQGVVKTFTPWDLFNKITLNSNN